MSEPKVPSVAKYMLATVLSSPVTLAKFAASGMFASVLLMIPQDVHSADIKVHYEGVLTKRFVLEVYAPGDETGWAVVYKEAVDGIHTGEVELILGKWELFRGETDYSREAQKGKREAEAGLALDLAKGLISEDSLVAFKATPGETVHIDLREVDPDTIPEGEPTLDGIIKDVAAAGGLSPDDADSQIEEDMYKEYFRGEGYP
ncbi:hypothetical protein LCGC14_2519170 [marine sediment metagenome]|uniref:Uncharacterized protein n=1 Tax=marine sediment metagenome TaxID=412755 RepID=A0A0F9AXB8_9ZZZZ